jgi:hypothetical protein
LFRIISLCNNKHVIQRHKRRNRFLNLSCHSLELCSRYFDRIHKILETTFNKIGFRPVSRQQQDKFRNKLFSYLSCRIFCCLFTNFFGPTFWCAFLSTQYKRRAILSMQYKSLLPFFRGGGGCRSLS